MYKSCRIVGRSVGRSVDSAGRLMGAATAGWRDERNRAALQRYTYHAIEIVFAF